MKYHRHSHHCLRRTAQLPCVLSRDQSDSDYGLLTNKTHDIREDVRVQRQQSTPNLRKSAGQGTRSILYERHVLGSNDLVQSNTHTHN